MAQFLIRAIGTWMDEPGYTPVTTQEILKYSIRRRKGDVSCVQPDGWIWGTKEGPPTFIVVKVNGLNYVDAVKYMDQLKDDNGTLQRVRRYSIPETVVDSIMSAGGTATISKTAFLSQLRDGKA